MVQEQGVELTQEKVRARTVSTTGGHSEMRLLANAAIARSINDLVSVAQKAIAANKTVTIIDLGAKYMKTSRLLLKMFEQRHIDPNRWFYSP